MEMTNSSDYDAGGLCLVVDDEPTSVKILQAIVKQTGNPCMAATNQDEMEQILRREPVKLVFLDYQLNEVNGLELLAKILAQSPFLNVVMITAYGSIELCLEALRLGASGFITKPFDQETVHGEIRRAFRKTPLRLGQNTGLIGQSSAIDRIHHQIEKMKDVTSTVLITGESGTGKELIARSLHTMSVRADERFGAVNCAAIPEPLLEAELFGYRQGAFTDAKKDRAGLFELCSKGTLFLDEVGELPLAVQAKLLRVLQEKSITPLGASDSVRVGTRVVAATNRHLKAMVDAGTFRKDLYYRLSVLQIDCPPLRERPEDIRPLTEYFLQSLAQSTGKLIHPPGPQLMARLEAYDWPGNIRELQNALERALILSEDGHLDPVDLFSDQVAPPRGLFEESSEALLELSQAKNQFEKQYLERVLTLTRGNVAKASKIAGRIRTDMYRLFSKHDLDPAEFKK